jgi:hypothetical protein
MQAVFKYELEQIELENIKKYCDSVEYCSIDQYPGWSQLLYKSRICYFYLYDETGIKSYSLIGESRRSAYIDFGPVCCDKDIMITSLNEIIRYYREKRYFYLGVQMYYKSSYDTDYIEYALNRLYKIRYFFNNENTKSSLEINLQDSLEEISRGLRKGHKSDIKKAAKLGLTVCRTNDEKELNAFFDVYAKMCKSRNIEAGEFSGKDLKNIYNFLTQNNKGEILVVKDNEGTVLGGGIFVYQGITVRYLKGAANPDIRDIPILHIVLFDAIRRAKEENFRYFDFWGYNHFANKDDQVYYINHFKKGFGGYFTFFAKKMNIDIIRGGYKIHKSLSVIKRIVKKLMLK